MMGKPETRVYMDHAATTPCDPRVVEAMQPFFSANYGNPSGLYAEGRKARRAIDAARDQTAELLGAVSPSEIVFTGSGSEADNLAIKGVAREARSRGLGDHIIVSQIEHHAVLHTARALQAEGFSVTYVPPESDGIVDPERIAASLTHQTILVSVMLANNEIGTLQPVHDIAAICREHGILFHTDAVQAVGQVPIDVQQLGVDLLSISAHKFYGPKGVGALYVRKNIKLLPHVHGGGQELERRAGTENVAGVIGQTKALEIAVNGLATTSAHLTQLRDALIEGVLNDVPGATLNGHPTKRLPGNAHFSFVDVAGESLLLNLDMHGIAASGGSACSAGSIEPSYVLSAMGRDREQASRALRLTLGRHTTLDEVRYVISTLPQLVAKLRNASERGKG